jgi:Undecaprenyl-phosphate galactose phosphotransferase WbaP
VARPRPALSALLIFAADIAVVVLAMVGSVSVRYLFQGHFHLSFYWRLWPFVALFISIYGVFGLYPGVAIGPVDELRRATAGTTLGFLFIGALTFFLRVADDYSRLVFLGAWLIALVCVPLGRAFVRHRFKRRRWWGYPVLVFGAGDAARMLVATLGSRPEVGLRAMAVLDGKATEREICGVPVVKSVEKAEQLARAMGVRHAIVAMPEAPRAQLLALLESHASAFPHVYVIPDLDGLSSLGIHARDMCRMLTLELRKSLLLPGPRITKRAIDLTVATAVAVACAPLIALIALLIKLESRGPVFYSHERIGRKQQAFRVWKFRSMVSDADRVLRDYLAKHPELADEWARDHKLRNDPRITRIGRILRKTSLDELPQLWNVLCGQMSLVGPRPIVRDEVARYEEAFSLYTQVLPGLTGMWQVSGRNDTTYAERVALDMYYVRNWSPWLDIYLLARTVSVVLSGSGAY